METNVERNTEESDVTNGTGGPPDGLRELPEERIRDVDVRDQLRRGEEPFDRIMGAVADLGEDSVLRVRALFEPEPLYGVLGARGFDHWTEQLDEEDWRVWFYRSPSAA